MTIEAQLDRIIELLEAKAEAKRPTKAEAKRPTKAAKPAPAATRNVEVPAPAASPSTTQLQQQNGAAPPAATPAAAATLDQVRNALVTLQTKLGSKEKPQSILAGYAKSGTLKDLAEADYGKVIAECTAA